MLDTRLGQASSFGALIRHLYLNVSASSIYPHFVILHYQGTYLFQFCYFVVMFLSIILQNIYACGFKAEFDEIRDISLLLGTLGLVHLKDLNHISSH
ncbi:unnamed protein product [Lupinus luteus]|uniref:Uncharacterized protein n=1 Tax=Lupinus luteus TaxID=3873 RepID=A0AAV1Y192_LUPLU